MNTDHHATNQPANSAPATQVSVTDNSALQCVDLSSTSSAPVMQVSIAQDMGTVKIIASEALAELHTLLEDARHLLEDCPAIGILDAGWRTRQQALIARIEAAATHGQAVPPEEGQA